MESGKKVDGLAFNTAYFMVHQNIIHFIKFYLTDFEVKGDYHFIELVR